MQPLPPAVVLAAWLLSPVAPAQLVIHVDDDATGGDGSSWASAFASLQDALAAADAGDEVWVAAGTYHPDRGVAQILGDRGATFALESGVEVYGGFAGGEALLSDRAGLFEQTILSGDLEGDDGLFPDDDNSLHVVTATGVDTTALLDGFTITDGNANLPVLFGDPSNGGAGLLCTGSSPTLRNLRLVGNQARSGGGGFVRAGGMISDDGSPLLVGCTFLRNRAVGDDSVGGAGGGLSCAGTGTPVLVDCRFLGNTCFGDEGFAGRGGGMSSTADGAVLIDCEFSGNSTGGDLLLAVGGGLAAGGVTTVIGCTFYENRVQGFPSEGGGIYADYGTVSVVNTILWGNVINFFSGGEEAQIGGIGFSVDHCDIEGWTGALGGTGNIGLDPMFRDADGPDGTPGTEDDDLRLRPRSPCIDAGDTSAVPPDTTDSDGDGDTAEPKARDLGGGPRRVDDPGVADTGVGPAPVVDIGAHEARWLESDAGELMLASGGTVTFSLDATAPAAGLTYLLLGSASGTAPATPVDALQLPLVVPDPYFDLVLAGANGPMFAGTLGALGAGGTATAALNAPASLPPALAGLVLHHAYLVFAPAGHAILASNAVALELVP